MNNRCRECSLLLVELSLTASGYRSAVANQPASQRQLTLPSGCVQRPFHAPPSISLGVFKGHFFGPFIVTGLEQQTKPPHLSLPTRHPRRRSSFPTLILRHVVLERHRAASHGDAQRTRPDPPPALHSSAAIGRAVFSQRAICNNISINKTVNNNKQILYFIQGCFSQKLNV